MHSTAPQAEAHEIAQQCELRELILVPRSNSGVKYDVERSVPVKMIAFPACETTNLK
jgi:hypothetical protein